MNGNNIMGVTLTRYSGDIDRVFIKHSLATKHRELSWYKLCRYMVTGGITRARFYYHGLTLITAWRSNYTHYYVWVEITFPFLNFNGATVEG